MLDLDDHFELWEPPPHLIDKARLPGLPRHGIGRALKVSKEQIVALLTALRLFVSGAYDAELVEKRRLLDQVVEGLRGLPAAGRVRVPADGQGLPILELTLEEKALGRSALEVCQALRRGEPPVHVGHGCLDEGKLLIHPLHLDAARTAVLVRCLREALGAPG
jgi:L-seryl-tRNA(Ser) seleniumtransferase